MKKILLAALSTVFLFSTTACSNKTAQKESTEKQEDKSIVMATTTSTQDSGLLDYLLPIFEKEKGIKVKVVAKGTGEALKLGERGDADVLLVHAKEQEEKFIKDGFGVKRYDVMYNDFIIVGPKSDPAKIKEKAPSDAIQALKTISESGSQFISRGDESGTHTKEKGLWKAANITPQGNFYVSAGKGMGAVLQMASEKNAYTLTDRATYLSMKDKLDLIIVTEKNDKLYNQYGVIKLNPEKNKIKEKEADEFINWIISDNTQKLIAEFGKEKYGQSLFIPNAKK
ncbi:substrate-binding domain-containing protein [Clostridium magnum]|uniref:PBP superfamily domain protein n=1 Tax=Clostridium magnum DSM 2767 TaxID=1121326 RepID=A0A161WY71_9CLOT|nr:substrate-binding domain-containing protein [Clostridium magnum]KZL92018.1 PBP superfamily domain protein [Clostridium magnum DSM 2767]SHH25742.1 tungstate transport system substrate-binding protein [Clostridium magnum DSM 2767]